MFTDVLDVVIVAPDAAEAASMMGLLQDGSSLAKHPRIDLRCQNSLAEGPLGWIAPPPDAVLLDLRILGNEEPACSERFFAFLDGTPIILVGDAATLDLRVKALDRVVVDYVPRSQLSGPLLRRSVLYAVELQRARLALLLSEQRYQQLLGSINSYTYSVEIVDGHSTSTHHGPGCLATTGYAPSDYATDPFLWFRMIHPEDRPMVLQHLARLESGERVSPIEHRIRHRDGTMRWIRNSAIPRYDAFGNLCRYDGLLENITERKDAELALRKSEADLLAARDVQQRLLPDRPPVLPGYELAGSSFPCETVGGDYFDFVPMLDDQWGIVIADGTGHGLAAALLAVELQATLRTLVQTYRTPAKILTLANRILFPGMPDAFFITVLFARLDARNGTCSFITAGHPPPLILDMHGRLREVPTTAALPLGILENTVFSSEYSVRLNVGDVVLLFSDGMYEVSPPGGRILGVDALVDIVRCHLDQPADEIIRRVHEEVVAHGQTNKPQDDMTFVVLKAVMPPVAAKPRVGFSPGSSRS